MAGTQIISHLYRDRENGLWTVQTNENHQNGVAQMSSCFAGEFGFSSWGRILGLLHDKGRNARLFSNIYAGLTACLLKSPDISTIITMHMWVESWQINCWEKMC